MYKNKKPQKPKRLSTEDFNAIYQLIRDSSKHPDVKALHGQTKGQETLRMY